MTVVDSRPRLIAEEPASTDNTEPVRCVFSDDHEPTLYSMSTLPDGEIFRGVVPEAALQQYELALEQRDRDLLDSGTHVLEVYQPGELNINELTVRSGSVVRTSRELEDHGLKAVTLKKLADS